MSFPNCKLCFFYTANEEDGRIASSHHSLGHAAEQKTIETVTAVRSDYDKVGGPLVSLPINRVANA